MTSPIERMIDRSVRCMKCSQGMGVCECWDGDPKVAPRLKSRKWHAANPGPHAEVPADNRKPRVLFSTRGPKG